MEFSITRVLFLQSRRGCLRRRHHHRPRRFVMNPCRRRRWSGGLVLAVSPRGDQADVCRLQTLNVLACSSLIACCQAKPVDIWGGWTFNERRNNERGRIPRWRGGVGGASQSTAAVGAGDINGIDSI